MKQLVVFILTLLVLQTTTFAAVNGKPINVDGHFKESNDVPVDEELKSLRSELKNVRTLKQNYQKKEKVYGKLVKESEGLKENFETYLEQRDEWNEAIGGYNQLLECTKNKAAKDCLKNSKKKKASNESQSDESNQVSNPVTNNMKGRGRPLPVQKETLQEQWEKEIEGMEMDNVKMSSSAPNRNGNFDNFMRNFDQTVAAKGMDLNLCYQQSRTKQQGVLPVMMKVGPGGRLDHLTFLDTTQIYNRYLVNCLTRVLYSINYPRTPNNNLVSIKKVFTFELHNI